MIRDEVRVNGTAVDEECLAYVLDQEVGSSRTKFGNLSFPRDCDENGARHDRKNPVAQG